MRVRLLGPVDVMVSGPIRPVPGLRRKVVLAVLALCYGEVVSTDRLADVVCRSHALRRRAPQVMPADIRRLRKPAAARWQAASLDTSGCRLGFETSAQAAYQLDVPAVWTLSW